MLKLVNGFRKTGLYPFNEKALDDKTIKSLTDEDAIFKTNMRRKPDKSEKAVIKAVKESLKPRVNAAVEAAEKKRNNLKRIQCLSGEVMTEDSSMARLKQHEEEREAKKKGKGKAKAQGVSISVTTPQDNKRKCVNTLDSFIVKKPRVMDAPVKGVTNFLPVIDEPEVINLTFEDPKLPVDNKPCTSSSIAIPVVPIPAASVPELPLTRTLDEDFVQVVKSNFSDHFAQLTVS